VKFKYFRWLVVFLIVLATIVSFIDRQAIAVLWPFIATDLYPDKTAEELKNIYAMISVCFISALTFGYLVSGKVFDWIGTRLGFAVLIVISSFAMFAHAFAKGVVSLVIARVMIGVAGAGRLPGVVKSNAEWFPTKDRALGISVVNIGDSISGMIAIPVVASLAFYFSWQTVFILLGLTGLLWLIPWLILVKASPKNHPWVSAEERDYILTGEQKLKKADPADDQANTLTIREVLCRKQSWGIIIAYAALEPISFLCITWLPIYLVEAHGMDLIELAAYGWIPSVGALLGALTSGVFARILMSIGWSLTKVRKLIITLGCLITLLSLLVMISFAQPLIIAIGLFGLSLALCNIQVLPADFFDAKVLGRFTGIILFLAASVSSVLTILVPWFSQGGDYTKVIVLISILVFIALASFWLLCPKIESLESKRESSLKEAGPI